MIEKDLEIPLLLRPFQKTSAKKNTEEKCKVIPRNHQNFLLRNSSFVLVEDGDSEYDEKTEYIDQRTFFQECISPVMLEETNANIQSMLTLGHLTPTFEKTLKKTAV
ncbi:hypothetical protein ACFE04_020617 [Oxalis oulophora]